MEPGSNPETSPDVVPKGDGAALANAAAKPAVPKKRDMRMEQPQGAFDLRDSKKLSANIVDLFYRQIRYGCGNPACRTATCHTFRSSRNSGQPFRKPTKLTARAMAACMAGSKDPYARICPHGILTSDDPLDTAFPLAAPELLFPPDPIDAEIASTITGRKPTDTQNHSPWRIPPSLERPSSPGPIDEKSATQMLFNTIAWQSARSTGTWETMTTIMYSERWQHINKAWDALLAWTRVLEDCYDNSDAARENPRLDGKATIKALEQSCVVLRQALHIFLLQERINKNHTSFGEIFATWVAVRQRGRFITTDLQGNSNHCERATSGVHSALAAMLQDPHLLRLTHLIIIVFASRTYSRPLAEKHHFRQLFADSLRAIPLSVAGVEFASILLEWCRYVLQLEWDGKATFSWSSMTGATINLMGAIYSHREKLNLDPGKFWTSFLFDKTDFLEVAKSWLALDLPPNHAHLLSFPWLFAESSHVSYFRAMNHTKMGATVNASLSLHAILTRHSELARNHEMQIYDKLRVAISQFLVLEIKRENILGDALSELWRRGNHELQRPLKVRMGMEEGEEGVDLGGVQQEFFRLVFAEALNPDYGLFRVDEQTRMAWFMPCSQAPEYQYTLMGLLMGLAVYNGVTLSVTFPVALYGKLLDRPVDSLEHLSDGWPDLVRGLRALLDHGSEDVEDVFARSYVFSGESNGSPLEINMQHQKDSEPWPLKKSSPSDSPEVLESAPMVTNINRNVYVQDYVQWLAHKSVAAEYQAFAKGFFSVVDRHALSIFNPRALRNLVEGFQTVDVQALRRTALYENGYSSSHAVVKNFWAVVEKFTPAETLKLLEFVTASDRIPARGIEGVTFILQKNGEDDERLPTSMTCFGRLLLPAYSTIGVMETKVRQAVENSLGFGVA